MGALLDLFRNKWPYTDFHELNADWIISTVRELIETMDSFIQNESISFADPITWNITTQYAKATVVLDNAGNAYLSKQPVPAGVQLNNGEYWQEIFNFTTYTRTANRNLTFNVETNTTRATAAYSVNDWLILNDVLYKVTSPIAIDDTFIIAPAAGSNIVHFTVEDFIKAWIASATALINQYKNDIDASELAYRQQLAQDIATTTTNLQAQLDAAIAGATVDSEVINARVGVNGFTFPTLGDAIRSQIDSLQRIVKHTVIKQNSGNLLINWNFGGYDSGGTINSNNTYAYSDKIAIEGNEVYTICNLGASAFVVFYDTDDNVITRTPNYSGATLTKYQVYDPEGNTINNRMFIVSPSDAKTVRISLAIRNIGVDDLLYKGFYYGTDLYPPYYHEKEDVETLNYFTTKNAVYGWYLSPNNVYGSLITGRATDYLPYFNDAYIYNGTGGVPVLVYDSNKNFITSYANNDAFNTAQALGQISTSAAYIKMYFIDAKKDIFYGRCRMPHGWIPKLKIPYGEIPEKMIVEYEANEVSQFADSLNTSFVRGDLLLNIPLEIHIKPGTYDLTQYLNHGDLSDTYGLSVWKNTHLIGDGDKHEIIIKVEFADNESGQRAYLCSTLNVNQDNASIENVTLIAKNCRYALHDDTNNNTKNIHNKFINVDFIHEGNNTGLWAYPSALGMGTSENSEYIFKNCMFKSPYIPAGVHNNQGEAMDSSVIFELCEMVSSASNYGLNIEEYNTDDDGIIYLKVADCYISPEKILYHPVANNPLHTKGYIFGSGSHSFYNGVDGRQPNIIVVT